MLAILIISHLLGDYIFQFNAIARWKARSIWGVVAHGGIVTLTTVACVLPVYPVWWFYALLIGLLHTLIDVVRARLIHTQNTKDDLAWLLLDQGAHLAVIVGMVLATGAPALENLRGLVAPSLAPLVTANVLIPVMVSLLLLQPAWVGLRFLVRGIYGADAAPHLGLGEKYPPMIERFLIATSVCFGLFYLVPLILLPRRLSRFQAHGNTFGVTLCMTAHWAETALGVGLAIVAGLVARIVLGLF
ncbi:MAG: DUF3307 domain-containing protein [Anaerolineae bacterium]|nr:DUF3307 domain-containing protein [Anaerolineae bacterium]